RWNFPKQFLHLATMSSLSIVHYMAHPKPWHGTFFPWTYKESQVYVDLRKAHPIYNSLYRGISFDRKILYKYRSIRARIEHAIEKNESNQQAMNPRIGFV
ncbi:glycosyl transferase, partial [Rhizobium ruizarguesonis]